jgi:hypothetical protein
MNLLFWDLLSIANKAFQIFIFEDKVNFEELKSQLCPA